MYWLGKPNADRPAVSVVTFDRSFKRDSKFSNSRCPLKKRKRTFAFAVKIEVGIITRGLWCRWPGRNQSSVSH